MMERLTFEGNFCDIAVCQETPGGSFCESGMCSQRKVWERLKHYEDMEEQGRLFIPPCAIGERWRDTRGEVFNVDGFYCDKWVGWSILYHYEDGEDCACNSIYFKSHFTREEAEQALKGGAET